MVLYSDRDLQIFQLYRDHFGEDCEFETLLALQKISLDDEDWLEFYFEDVAPMYLVSNLGRCFSLKSCALLPVVYEEGEVKKYYIRLKLKKANGLPLYRRIPIQKILALTFKNLPGPVLRDPLVCSVQHLTGDRNSLDLDQLYFVEKFSRRSVG